MIENLLILTGFIVIFGLALGLSQLIVSLFWRFEDEIDTMITIKDVEENLT